MVKDSLKWRARDTGCIGFLWLRSKNREQECSWICQQEASGLISGWFSRKINIICYLLQQSSILCWVMQLFARDVLHLWLERCANIALEVTVYWRSAQEDRRSPGHTTLFWTLWDGTHQTCRCADHNSCAWPRQSQLRCNPRKGPRTGLSDFNVQILVCYLKSYRSYHYEPVVYVNRNMCI